jgi:hypothetical protein
MFLVNGRYEGTAPKGRHFYKKQGLTRVPPRGLVSPASQQKCLLFADPVTSKAPISCTTATDMNDDVGGLAQPIVSLLADIRFRSSILSVFQSKEHLHRNENISMKRGEGNADKQTIEL